MIVFVYSIAIFLMVATPVAAAVLLRRRFNVPWFLFLFGMATFTVSQIVHIPLNEWLADVGLLPEGGFGELPLWRTALILGLSAGVCEELSRAAGYALLRQRRRFEDGVMLGVGHGGIESMVFGGVQLAAVITTLLSLQSADLTTLNFSADQMAALTQQMDTLSGSPLLGLLPYVERCIAMVIHVVLSLLVWRAFAKSKSWWYIPLAVLYHALFDAVAVYVAQQTESLIIVYGTLLLILVPGVIWAWRVGRKEAGSRPAIASLRIEWRSFIAATRKELLQQWRTRRLIIVAAVFAFVGMSSPLFAKFMPEIFRSIPGAEQFAGLIPEPTLADVTTQYVKNLQQFGFMVVVLLGMGAIAGEKDKGTAALVLCKPLPRWAFVCSKFTAQTFAYILGFLVAMVCTFYYTWFLFGPVNFGAFAFCNLLLFVWLTAFVAVTLTGSALTNSIGAAAGVGFGGAVLLMLAGSLPTLGSMMPGALLAWATQVGLGTSTDPIPANGGALVATIVIIILGVIGAIAAFEQQEL
ncbi:MAG: YhfC family intramembrane metalloprotease [Anaerolineae bacterium]|nr:YhfC family intramembrane metalloprotease [Anaerolineae bacterium]